MRALLAAVAAAALLTACGESEPKGDCVRSHQEQVPPTYVKSGNVLIPVGGGTRTVCDEYTPVEDGDQP